MKKLVDLFIRNGRRIYCLVDKNNFILFVPVEANIKIKGKPTKVTIKDVKNPLSKIKLLAC